MSDAKASLSFDPADLVADRLALVDLNAIYMRWLEVELRREFGVDMQAAIGATIETYIDAALPKLCAPRPPAGVFYLVRSGADVAGMGGLRPLWPGAVEMKRIFVHPGRRGGGIGAAIVARLIADAHAFGYRQMVLETAPFMRSAHRLYEAEGFRDRPPFAEAEVPAVLHPRWRFMERSFVCGA